jgi:hypothetical protein
VKKTYESKNAIWRDLVEELAGNRVKSKWFTKVRKEVNERQLAGLALTDGASYVEKRKEFAVQFSQFCFH